MLRGGFSITKQSPIESGRKFYVGASCGVIECDDGKCAGVGLSGVGGNVENHKSWRWCGSWHNNAFKAVPVLVVIDYKNLCPNRSFS